MKTLQRLMLVGSDQQRNRRRRPHDQRPGGCRSARQSRNGKGSRGAGRRHDPRASAVRPGGSYGRHDGIRAGAGGGAG